MVSSPDGKHARMSAQDREIVDCPHMSYSAPTTPVHRDIRLELSEGAAFEASLIFAPTRSTEGNPDMALRTTATSVDYLSTGDTGALVSFNYVCPHCHTLTGEFIFVGASGVDTVNSGFETDQMCGICDKEVTIGIPSSLF